MDFEGDVVDLSQFTAIERNFIISYVKNGDVILAMRESGSKSQNEKTLRAAGYRMLQKNEIARAIKLMEREVIVSAGLDANDIIIQMKLLAAEAIRNKKYDVPFKIYEKFGDRLGMWESDDGKKGLKEIGIFQEGQTIEETLANQLENMKN